MNKKYILLGMLAALLVVGFVEGLKSPTSEYELCKRQSQKRLSDAMDDPDVTKEAWLHMLKEETKFLLTVANEA